MSLERARMPSEMIRSTSRTTGRWLASASEAAIAISSGAVLGDPLLRSRVRFVQLGDLQSKPGGERGEDLRVVHDLLGNERLPQGRLGRGLLPQLGDELRRDHPLEGVGQPFIGEGG